MATVIHHPNREKAESKATKAIVVLLLIVSAALVLVITFGGWSALQGGQPFAILYAALNLFDNPALDPALLGLLTLALIPVQALLVAFAARAFSQRWNVELEVEESHSEPPARGGAPAPLGA